MFYLDAKDLRKLKKFYKNAPRRFSRASAGVLNTYAFALRQDGIETINRTMTVRNPRFVSSRMRVLKARASDSMRQQEAVSGSIRSPRFTGWEEQQTGQQPAKNRFATLFARGQDEGKQIRPALRMRPSRRFLSEDDFDGQNDEHRVVVMLKTLSRQKYRKPFVIKKHKRMKPGLYKFHRRRLMRVQTFERGKIKRIPWMTSAQRRTLRRLNERDVWANEVRRALK